MSKFSFVAVVLVSVVALAGFIYYIESGVTGNILGQDFDIWVGDQGPFRTRPLVHSRMPPPPYSIGVANIIVNTNIQGPGGAFCFNVYDYVSDTAFSQTTFCYGAPNVADQYRRYMRHHSIFVSDLFSV